MAVTDWKYPGTASGANWLTPDNIKAADTLYASTNVGKNTTSDVILGSNFRFSSSDIPSGSTINGIEFVINRYSASANYLIDLTLYLQLSASNVGNNLASATTWPSSVTTTTYGGATDMCGTSLTQANILDNSFGLQLNVYNSDSSNAHMAYIDYFKIRVYYTAGGGGVSIPVLLCSLGEY